MDKILEKMEDAAEAERNRIVQKKGFYHTPHEGYAVLLEEVEEAHEEMESLGADMKSFWRMIREDNDTEAANIADMMYQDAIRGAAELIQVAAVCKKFMESTEVTGE